MKLTDLHCDTLLECFDCGLTLKNNALHISLERAAKYEKYTQVLGIYSEKSLPDDKAYEKFLRVSDFFAGQRYVSGLPAESVPGFTPVLAVEGANLLGGDITRLDELHRRGVKFLTLVWGGSSCIGGAHNDGGGLTDFGRAVAHRCTELGIIIDVSHSSDKLFWEAAEIAREAGKPIAATHSNSRTVKNHTRNLTDGMFRQIAEMGGLVGVSLVRGHLRELEACGIDDIVAHIEHYLSLGGEKTVCMGGDLDGTAPLPDGIGGIEDIYKIADRLASKNHDENIINAIFYGNADNFMRRNGIYK